MPKFLRENEYADFTDGNNTIFQPAYSTEKNTYEWFSQNHEHKAALVRFMGMQQVIRGKWLHGYPFERDTEAWDTERPVFVDIGGNVGHYCALFKKTFPRIPGQVFLQDLQETIAQALDTPGVKTISHDFFERQPIQGE